MRAYEFLSERPIEEGASSAETQYNSELGCMLGLIGANATIDELIKGDYNKFLINPNDLVAHAKNGKAKLYNEKTMNNWIARGAAIKNNFPEGALTGKVGWDGVGQGNFGDVADVVFEDGTHSGISIKDTTGITLTNKSPTIIGFEKGGDIFQKLSPSHWEEWKLKIIEKVLQKAEASPTRIIPRPPKDSKGNPLPAGGSNNIRAIQYNKEDYYDEKGEELKTRLEPYISNGIIDAEVLKKKLDKRQLTKVNGAIVAFAKENEIDDIPQLDGSAHWFPGDTYTLWYGKSGSGWHRTAFSKKQIEDIAKKGNNVTQRVFGDWYQEIILTDKEVATWHNKLFEDFANHAIDTMNTTLANDSTILNQLLQMSEEKSYLYVTPEKAYDVPGTKSGIKVKLQQVEGITKPEVDGVSQKFYVRVQNAEKEGIDETQFARLELYIRYANGLFASNPTLRIQSLENPEHLSWTPI